MQVNSDEAIQSYFAAATLGAVYVPLNYRARGAELAHMVNEAAPRVLLAGAEYAGLVCSVAGGLSSVERYVALGGQVDGWPSVGDIAAGPADDRPAHGEGDELAVILFTAGTTLRPKGRDAQPRQLLLLRSRQPHARRPGAGGAEPAVRAPVPRRRDAGRDRGRLLRPHPGGPAAVRGRPVGWSWWSASGSPGPWWCPPCSRC